MGSGDEFQCNADFGQHKKITTGRTQMRQGKKSHKQKLYYKARTTCKNKNEDNWRKKKNLESVEYSKSFPLVEKTIKATSASQRTEIS